MKLSKDNQISAAHLMIVDDDRAIRDALSEGLSLTGIELTIDTAQDAPSAILVATSEVPDVVILDLNMPMADGFELAKALQSIPALRETKYLMLTAQASHTNAWASMEHGIDVFIGKPFDIEDVEANIFSLLHRTLEKRPHHS